MTDLLVDQRPQPRVFFKQLAEFGDRSSLFTIQSGKIVQDKFLIGSRLGCRIGGEWLPAPDTPILVSRRFFVAPRADQWSQISVVVVSSHIKSHQSSVLIADIFVKNRDVAGDSVRPGNAPLPLFNISGVHALSGKPREIRLPEVRRRDGFLDASPIRRPFEHIQIRPITKTRRRREPAPERIISTTWMVRQPLAHVRSRRDQLNRSLTSLTVHADSHSVRRISEIPHSEIEQLPTAQASVKLQRDRRFITGVASRLKHRLNVIVPGKHLGWIWTGVVISRQRRFDPVDRRRGVVAEVSVDAAAKNAQRNTIVLVGLGRLLEVVSAMDPSHHCFGSRSVCERIGQVDVDFFGDTSTMSEEFDVSMPAVSLAHELQLVAELEQDITIAVRSATVTVPEFRSESVDLLFGVDHTLSFIHWLMSVWFKSHPWLLSVYSHANSKPPSDTSITPVTAGRDTPHPAIATPVLPSVVARSGSVEEESRTSTPPAAGEIAATTKTAGRDGDATPAPDVSDRGDTFNTTTYCYHTNDTHTPTPSTTATAHVVAPDATVETGGGAA